MEKFTDVHLAKEILRSMQIVQKAATGESVKWSDGVLQVDSRHTVRVSPAPHIVCIGIGDNSCQFTLCYEKLEDGRGQWVARERGRPLTGGVARQNLLAAIRWTVYTVMQYGVALLSDGFPLLYMAGQMPVIKCGEVDPLGLDGAAAI